MKDKLIYSSDMDRTLIFSEKFLRGYPTTCSYHAVEYRDDGTVISYMADEVKKSLNELASHPDIVFIPVTSRSKKEYDRIKLGFTPEYAIVANGGIILHHGIVIDEYSKYVRSKINRMDILTMCNDIKDYIPSVTYEPKLIDGCYIFFKTDNPENFDAEVDYLVERYPDWEFTRQVSKCYAVPKHFSKQVALRWLWHRLGKPYVVASGDSQLDLPMLALANRAIIPSHGSLVKEKYVESGTIVDGGILSPLETMKIVKGELEKL